jgi:hypothetical protein
MLIKENDPRKNHLGMLLLSDESDCNVVDDDELDNMRAALVS